MQQNFQRMDLNLITFTWILYGLPILPDKYPALQSMRQFEHESKPLIFGGGMDAKFYL